MRGLAASIGIAPELLYLDPQSGLMLTRFIAGGVALRAAELRRPELLRSAVGLLRRLHGSGLVFAGRMDLFPKLDEYIALAAQKGWPAGLDLTPIRRQAEPARAGPGGGRDAVRSQPRRSGSPQLRPRLVGPLPARLGIRRHGRADVGPRRGRRSRRELDAARDRILLDEYFGSAAPRQAGRFALYKASLNLIAAAWAVVQIVDGNPGADFAAFAHRRLAWHALQPRPPPIASTLRRALLIPIVESLNGVPSWLRGARPAGRRQPDEPDPDNAGGGI